MSREFPVLMSYQERKAHPECPRSIPWDRIAPHEAQAKHNHDQTLERLAQRGGLGPGEIRCAVEGVRLRTRTYDEGRDTAWLIAWLAQP